MMVTLALPAKTSQRGCSHQLHLLMLLGCFEEDWVNVNVVDVLSIGLESV